MGCSAARGPNSPRPDSTEFKLKHSIHGFAQILHRELKAKGIKTIAMARTFDVVVYSDDSLLGINAVSDRGWMGVKSTSIDEKEVWKRIKSKILYYWNDESQRQRWVDYELGNTVPINFNDI